MMKKALYILLLLAMAISCKKEPPPPKVIYPVFGVAPLLKVEQSADVKEVFLRWAKDGLDKNVLVYGGPRHYMEVVSDDAIKRMASAMKDQDWAALERELEALGGKGYFYAAVRVGLLDKVVWMPPKKFFQSVATAQPLIVDFMQDPALGIGKDDLATFNLLGGCMMGTVGGAPLRVCSHINLLKIDEDVALLLDVSYITELAWQSDTGLLIATKGVMDSLSIRNYHVRRMDILYQPQIGLAAPQQRYVSDMLSAVALKPMLLLEGPPELWHHWDMSEYLSRTNSGGHMLSTLKGSFKKYPGDATLGLFEALALTMDGKFTASRERVAALCKAHSWACDAYVYLGDVSTAMGNSQEAALFYAAAPKGAPAPGTYGELVRVRLGGLGVGPH